MQYLLVSIMWVCLVSYDMWPLLTIQTVLPLVSHSTEAEEELFVVLHTLNREDKTVEKADISSI